METWIINSLLQEKSDKEKKKSDRERNYTLNELLPIEVVPELYDKSICYMLAESAREAKEIYETMDIVEVHELLAIKNALNYTEEKE